MGVTWTVGSPSNMTGKNTWPAMKDDNNGFCLKFYSTTDTLDLLASTSDGGTTYTPATYTGQLFNNQLQFVPGTTSTWAASGVDATNQPTRVGIVYSFDDGASFNAVDQDVSGTQITCQAFFNDSVAYAGTFTTGATDGILVLTAPVVPAVASFTANDTAIALHSHVLFTNTSTGIKTGTSLYQWTFQGGTPSSSTSKNPSAITYNTAGTYNVTLTITNVFGSVNTLVKHGYIYVGGVGVDEISQNNIKVYPNPVRDVFTIETDYNMQEIQVFNITGQLMIDKIVSGKSQKVNTTSLHSGVYNLKVKTDNGSFDRKVVVQ
jgi:PKD repeat protein